MCATINKVIDLAKTSGLPLTADHEGRLAFGEGLETVTPAVRRLAEMQEVLMAAGQTGRMNFIICTVMCAGYRIKNLLPSMDCAMM